VFNLFNAKADTRILSVIEKILPEADIEEKTFFAAKDAKSAKKNIFSPQMNANKNKENFL